MIVCNRCKEEKKIQCFEFRKDRGVFRKTCKDCKNLVKSKNKSKKVLQSNFDLQNRLLSGERDDFFQFFLKRNFRLDSLDIVRKMLDELYPINISIKTKIYLYYKNLKAPPRCKYCNDNFTKLINSLKGFHEFCSQKCASNSNEVKDKIQKTNLSKFGTITPLLNDEIKSKYLQNIIDKWGVDNISKSEEIKTKKSTTMLEKFGVEYNSQRVEIKKKLSQKLTLYNEKKNTIRHEKHWKEKLEKLNLQFISKEFGSIIEIKCPLEEHTFRIHKTTFNDRLKNSTPICTVCNPVGDTQSFKERELYDFIKSLYSKDIVQSYRDGLELDIYLPDLKIGFEFNGLFWHSDKFRDKNYHLNKLNLFRDKGIRVINIWEDDWIYKKSIIHGQIKNILGISQKIFARSCQVREIDDIDIIREFLNKNHIQGFIGSKIKLGLYHSDKLVSIMLFDQFEGRLKMSDYEWNLSRFCNLSDFTVVGGASKLLKYFITKYKPNRIISYSDNSWSTGGLYEKLGFSKAHETIPDYKYVVSDKRIHKSSFRKSKTGLSESLLTYDKIWDCGKTKWELKIQIQ